jgi:hypothetical protein
MWILGPGSFRVIGLSESQMQASTVILTNESGTSTVQIPSIAPVKVEPLGDVLFFLPPVALKAPSTYGRSMDGMDKMCDGHPWCTTKPRISKMTLDYPSGALLVLIISNVIMTTVIT